MKTVKMELEEIRESNNGILKAEDVVEYAKDPKTALHSRFTWDDTKAANEHRLWQAREVIRVCVKVHEPTKEVVKAYVSIVGDRKTGGGYRAIEDVLENDELREEMIRDIIAEFRRVQKKHRVYRELKPVYDAIDLVEQSHPLLKEAV